MLVKDWRWKLFLGIGHTYKLKSPVSAAKYLFGVVLRKNGSLDGLDHQGFLALLVVEQVCYMFVTVKEDAFRENYVVKFCGVMYIELWQGKPKVTVSSDQANLYMVPRVDS